MKEFVKNQKVTYNLMSFTGFKALIIFSLLTDGVVRLYKAGKAIAKSATQPSETEVEL